MTLLRHILIRIGNNMFPVFFLIIENYSTFQAKFVIFLPHLILYVNIDNIRPQTENLLSGSGLPGRSQHLKMFLTA
jgi:hypothetical protein